MTIYHLKEIISSKYNRKDTTRYERSVLFVVENTVRPREADNMSFNSCLSINSELNVKVIFWENLVFDLICRLLHRVIATAHAVKDIFPLVSVQW